MSGCVAVSPARVNPRHIHAPSVTLGAISPPEFVGCLNLACKSRRQLHTWAPFSASANARCLEYTPKEPASLPFHHNSPVPESVRVREVTSEQPLQGWSCTPGTVAAQAKAPSILSSHRRPSRSWVMPDGLDFHLASKPWSFCS